MACTRLRYGPDVIKEVGMDLANMKIKKVIHLFQSYVCI